MAKTEVITLDLNFQGMPQAIAVYLIKHSTGAILIECGPGTTLPALQAALKGKRLIRIGRHSRLADTYSSRSRRFRRLVGVAGRANLRSSGGCAASIESGKTFSECDAYLWRSDGNAVG